MNNKVNKKKLLLQEIYGTSPQAAYDGGTFGFGGDRQIVQKDQQVEKIRDQEVEEANQNIKDQMNVNSWVNEEKPASNVAKNIKAIKKYINLLRNSSKPQDAQNFSAKIDIEIKDLEQKLKLSEHSMTFDELSNIIREVIESELKIK